MVKREKVTGFITPMCREVGHNSRRVWSPVRTPTYSPGLLILVQSQSAPLKDGRLHSAQAMPDCYLKHIDPGPDRLGDVGSRPADMGIRGTRIAFLVAAKAHAPAARPTDIAGGKSDVHECTVRPVVVIPPDQPFLVGEHRTPAGIAGFVAQSNQPIGESDRLSGR